jgi:hypothetical protein
MMPGPLCNARNHKTVPDATLNLHQRAAFSTIWDAEVSAVLAASAILFGALAVFSASAIVAWMLD